MRVKSRPSRNKPRSIKTPILNQMKLSTPFGRPRKPNKHSLLKIARKIDTDVKKRLRRFRTRITQENPQPTFLILVLNPSRNRLPTLEINTFTSRISSLDRNQALNVEANMMGIRILEDRIKPCIKFNREKLVLGQLGRIDETQIPAWTAESLIIGGEEKGKTVAGGSGVDVGDGERESCRERSSKVSIGVVKSDGFVVNYGAGA
ncbi:hypothetical protein IC582_014696 [Cucumis melo]